MQSKLALHHPDKLLNRGNRKIGITATGSCKDDIFLVFGETGMGVYMIVIGVGRGVAVFGIFGYYNKLLSRLRIEKIYSGWAASVPLTAVALQLLLVPDDVSFVLGCKGVPGVAFKQADMLAVG